MTFTTTFKTKLTLTISCMLGMLTGPLLFSAPQAPQMQFPGAPGQMPPGGFPMGQMPMPSEDELEEALKFIQYLEENDPEQLKALEQMGQQMINQMSDEDLSQFSEAFNIAPDELRAEAAKALEQEGATQTSPQEQYQPEETPAQPVARVKAQPTKSGTEQAKKIVTGLIDALSSLRQKASGVREVHQMIRSWRQELRDIMFYLKVINYPEYHKLLALTENKNLLQSLSKLYGELKIEAPRILLPDELEEESTAYELLGVKRTASQKEIERAFNKLSDKHDPEKVEARLTVEGLTGKDLKRKVKQAKLAYEALEDAYEQLADPKMREQVNREVEAQDKQHKQDVAQAIEALKNITAALGQAIYSETLIVELESFLAQHAPTQLKQKKEMEAAEKKRTEEQKKAGEITPTQTGGTFERPESMPYYYDDNHGYYDDFAPYMYDDYNDYPDYEYGYPGATSDDSDAYGPKEEQPTATTDKSNKKLLSDSNQLSTSTDTKIDQRNVDTLIKDITNKLDGFHLAYNDAGNQKFLNDLDEYMHSATYETSTSKRALTTEEETARIFREELPGFEGDTPTTPIDTTMTEKIEVADEGITEKLSLLPQELKLDSLANDVEIFKKKLRDLTKPTEAQRKLWFKLEDKRNEVSEPITQLAKTLQTALTDRTDKPVNTAKKKAHEPQIATIVKLLDAALTTLNNSDDFFKVHAEKETEKSE